jgi:hypothetical protein
MRHRPALLLALVLAAGSEARAQCLGTPVAWPPGNPLWEFCYRRPSATRNLVDGGGLEISDVRFRGSLVLKMANVPILNVKYDEPNGCGGFDFCYRDWLYEEVAFRCAPESPVGSGQCTGTQQAVATVCQNPGADFGSFQGVAIEDLGDRLKLTSQTQAGWYRYIPGWEFYKDGTLRALFDTTSVDNGCVAHTHHHHAYFRFDVDVDAASGNVLDLMLPQGGSQRILAERSFTDIGAARSRWRISRPGSTYAVEVTRGPSDEAAGDPPPVANDFPIADGWALASHPDELDDGGMNGGCAARLDPFLTGESLDGSDLVLWVRAAALHIGEPGGVAQDCTMRGPLIRVVDLTPRTYNTVTPCRILDTRDPTGPYGGPALSPGLDRSIILAGKCNIPADARVVTANLTVANPASAGHIVAFPVGSVPPPTSVINFGEGQTRANNAVLQLATGGGVQVRAVVPTGPIHLILDVTGYFR